jgi:hypothetical protein
VLAAGEGTEGALVVNFRAGASDRPAAAGEADAAVAAAAGTTPDDALDEAGDALDAADGPAGLPLQAARPTKPTRPARPARPTAARPTGRPVGKRIVVAVLSWGNTSLTLADRLSWG